MVKGQELGVWSQNFERIQTNISFHELTFFLDKQQYIVVNILNYTKYSPSEHLSNRLS